MGSIATACATAQRRRNRKGVRFSQNSSHRIPLHEPSKTTKPRAEKQISLNPFQINHFASVSVPQNTLCLTCRAKPFLRTPACPLVNASLRPQRAQLAVFSRLPRLCFARRVRLAAPICAPATFTGGRFLPVSERNRELINSIARVVQPQAGVPEIHLVSTNTARRAPRGASRRPRRRGLMGTTGW